MDLTTRSGTAMRMNLATPISDLDGEKVSEDEASPMRLEGSQQERRESCASNALSGAGVPLGSRGPERRSEAIAARS